MTRRLDNLPRTPQTHFRLHLYGAILQLRRHLPAPGPDNGLEFLSGYYEQFEGLALPADPTAAVARWREHLDAWEAGVDAHLPLRALARTCGLGPLAMELLLAIGLPEEDLRFGHVFAALSRIGDELRPTAGVLSSWSEDDDARDGVRSLIAAGVVVVSGEDAARPRSALQVPHLLWDAMRGGGTELPRRHLRHRPRASLRPLDELLLEPETSATLSRLPGVLGADDTWPLVVRGSEGSGRHAVVAAVAHAMGCGVVDVADPADPIAGPLATLLHAVPVYELSIGPGDVVDLPWPSGYAGPYGVLLGNAGAVRGSQRRVVISLGVPDERRREELWTRAIGGAGASALARRFRLPAGIISAAGAEARDVAALDGRGGEATANDVLRALRALRGDSLALMAKRIEAVGDWRDLVVSEDTAEELTLLEERCRHRERLVDHVGPVVSPQSMPGVRVLLTGPSGTGKTLAARLLASALGKDLYSLDLSSVVNKYLGETEKNLEAVLAKAEEHDVVLLLDEGDALMTRRTDVASANDRYANLETNYLLQRLESFEGVIVVTTNAADRIDAAFKRRMDVVIEFRPPQDVERRRILALHLPLGHRVEEDRIDEIAARCSLTGGQIRNAALHAALLALRDDRPVTGAHLDAAVRREYRKAGLVCPLRSREPAVA